MRTVIVTGDGLTVQDVVDVARGEATAELGPDVPATMEFSRSVVAAATQGDTPVYGVNTGFGALADTPVPVGDLARLQGAIVRSHAAGTGAPLDDATVRAILDSVGAQRMPVGCGVDRDDRLAEPHFGRGREPYHR